MARKVIGPTGSRRRRWWFLVGLVVAVGAAAFFIAGAGAVVNGSPSVFESNDGNMTLVGNAVTTPPLNGNTDWNCFQGTDHFSSVTDTNLSSCAVTTGAQQVTADQSGEITWVNGQKFDTQCPGLQTGNVPNKDDFTNIAAYSEFNTTTSDPAYGDLFFYGAAIRATSNGNASGDVEFNQQAGDGTTTAGCRTAGDRLVAYDFLNGGTSLQFHVLTWIDAAHPDLGQVPSTVGLCYVKSDSMPCWGKNIIVPDSTTFDGEANQSPIAAEHNAISGAALNAQQFAEFGVDLTKALTGKTASQGGTIPCFPQQVWESRSSGSSFTSNPEDIEFSSVKTCGGIIIRKVTDPSPDAAGTSFSFSDNILSASDSFSLKNGDSKDFGSNVTAGLYSVSETAQPGYTLTSIDCSASTTTNGSSTAVSGATVAITLNAGDTIDCTYTNTLNTDSFGTQASTNSTVLPGQGTGVTDLATAKRLTGSSSMATPGDVTFYLCGPSSTALSGCSSTDTQVGSSSVALSGSGDTATATSDAVNTSSDALAVGYYCFGATWSGDSDFLDLPKSETGDASHECFQVVKDDTSTATTPWSTGDSTGKKVTSILLGGTVYDQAVVTGTARGGVPAGTVTFYECGPLTSGNCESGGNQVGTTAVSLDLAGTAFSAGFTPTDVGTYCFRAEYGGSDVYNTSSDPSDATSQTECFDVTQISTTVTTTPKDSGGTIGTNKVTFGDQTVYDYAKVAADQSGDGVPTGTVAFFLCDPTTVTTNGGDCHADGTSVATDTGLTDLGTNPPSAYATSVAYTNSGNGVNKTGKWCWRAEYTPGGANGQKYTGNKDGSTGECFTVTDTTTAQSTQTWYPNDSASVSGDGSGDTISGTLTLQLYSGDNCGETSGSAVGTQYSSGDQTDQSSISVDSGNQTTNGFSANATVSWLVTFTSDDSNVAGTTHCESSQVSNFTG